MERHLLPDRLQMVLELPMGDKELSTRAKGGVTGSALYGSVHILMFWFEWEMSPIGART